MPACHWNEVHAVPLPLIDFNVELDFQNEIKHVWLASPDGDSNQARQVEFKQLSGSVRVKIPRLDFWNVLFLETK
jgi:hypothetical protein